MMGIEKNCETRKNKKPKGAAKCLRYITGRNMIWKKV